MASRQQQMSKSVVQALGTLSQVPGFIVGFLAGSLALGVIAGYSYAADVVVRIADWSES